ncbi:MAG: Signal transduction histidine kinase [Myxococcales bacterium]|nr:Signal transduction histidine kinase [Myxococcales bacterium]
MTHFGGAAVGAALAHVRGMPFSKPVVLKRREQILIVEDDVESCEVMGAVLHDAGYSVDLAHDGYEALELAARRRPDLVVSDIRMPNLDGVELTRRLHRFDPELPVVFTTGMPNTMDLVTTAEDYGAAVCLQKPMKAEDLLWAIDRALELSRQRGRRPGAPTVPASLR